MKKALLFLFLGLIPALVSAQQDTTTQDHMENMDNRMYNPETVTTVSGTITKIVKTMPENQMHSGLHIYVQQGDENMEVHLGPEWYLNEQNIRLEEKEQVTIKGSQIEVDNRKFIIASVITMEKKEVVLRKENGIPLWSRKNMGKGKKRSM